MSQDPDPNLIDASPTKELFIYMLTRDIPLIRAILDLVDNSVDGATRSGASDDYSSYWVDIKCSKDSFTIEDNCGGIPIVTAKEYAFRFGRPKKSDPTPGSIGKFGVGMKRAFFKLGNVFKVQSTTRESSFIVKHNVQSWLEDPKSWSFKFEQKDESLDLPADDEGIGTIIEVKELYESVSETLSLKSFENQLRNQIELAHATMMRKGLVITLNNSPLSGKELSLLKSSKLTPAYFAKTYDNIGDSPVHVKIYAGLSERNIEDGGWYIFCNGRMILEADQSSMTTWGQVNNMPKYHPIYAYFRGFVLFESDDAELLPWTTTKTGIDLDSNLYKQARIEMINIITPILTFLRKLDKEREEFDRGEIDSNQFKGLLTAANRTNYYNITEAQHFTTGKINPVVKGPTLGRVQYNKPKDEIKNLKKALGVTSNKAVGEKTFEYFMKMECE